MGAQIQKSLQKIDLDECDLEFFQKELEMQQSIFSQLKYLKTQKKDGESVNRTETTTDYSVKDVVGIDYCDFSSIGVNVKEINFNSATRKSPSTPPNHRKRKFPLED